MTYSSLTYFGCSSGFLDITTLSYRWFGAIWRFEGSIRLILGYWFADSENALMQQVIKDRWIEYIATQNEIKDVYGII